MLLTQLRTKLVLHVAQQSYTLQVSGYKILDRLGQDLDNPFSAIRKIKPKLYVLKLSILAF